MAGNSKFLAINNKTCRALWCKQRGQRGDSKPPWRRFVAYTAACLPPYFLHWAPAGCRVFFSTCSRKPESGYSACADAFSAAFLPWAASAVDGRKNSAPDTFAGAFFTGMPIWCRSVAGSLPRRGVGCCVPLLTHLPSLCIHSVSLGQSGFLAPARLLPGLFFWRQRSCSGGRVAEAYRTKSGIFSDYFANEKPSAKPPPLAIRA